VAPFRERLNDVSSTEEDAVEDNAERAASVHREIFQLAVLIVAATAAFFLTRAVAANNRAMSLRDAAEWYTRGRQALESGRTDTAIEDFRRATVRNRTDHTYVLALARALARSHDPEAARRVLLTLRESEPEDAEVNLELARLAVHRGDLTEAVRFYHNALYAPWPAERADARRDVRFELIQFLLTQAQTGRAIAELLAIAADVPDEPAVHIQVGQFFFQAGDYRHSLDHFQRALHLAPDNGTALAGAGQDAFRLGDYVLARSYLTRAPQDLDGVTATKEISELVLADDPLAPRIGPAERRRRLVADIEYSGQQLDACVGHRKGGEMTSEDRAFQAEVEEFADQLTRPSVLDQDTIETGVDLVARVAAHIVQECVAATARDRAFVLIGRQHDAAPK
jgi:tetratricopeptide (TPR) repeat protein